MQEDALGGLWEETVIDFKEVVQWAANCLVLRRQRQKVRIKRNFLKAHVWVHELADNKSENLANRFHTNPAHSPSPTSSTPPPPQKKKKEKKENINYWNGLLK